MYLFYCYLIFIELGFDVRMIKMSNTSISVDVKKDLAEVKKILKRKK